MPLPTSANHTPGKHAPGFIPGKGYTLPEYPFVAPKEIATGEIRRHAVVIAGGGITGLALACALAHYGVRAVMLDEDNTVGVKGASSRGICYAQKTLEVFKRLGIYERVREKGVQWSVGRTFAGSDEVYAFDLRQQATHSLSLQPPFINIQQFYVEAFLVDQLLSGDAGERLIDLRWRHRITAFEQDANVATLRLETPAGSYTLQADHVLDCTGAHSPFRAWCSAAVTSSRGDDRWCIADVWFKHPPPVERHTWIEAPFNEGRAVWQHLMADGVWRIDYQMPPDADPQAISRDDVVRARLRAQFDPMLKEEDYEIVWVGPYAYRSECLNQLRHGRVFFLGDSAHVMSPFGARGGNSGVQDADNLAWKLAAVLQGRAPHSLLESYHDERHEAAEHNIRVTNRTARFLRPADGVERLFRSAALQLARQHPFARQLVNTGRMSTPMHYTRSGVCAPGDGRPTQNAALTWADGTPGELLQLITWASGRLLLLVFGNLSADACARLRALSSQTDVHCVQVIAPGQSAQAAEHVQDTEGHLQATCHVFGHAWALLRPDGHVAATGESVDASLVHAVAMALGASHHLQGEAA